MKHNPGPAVFYSGAPAARRAAQRSPIGITGKKRKPMKDFPRGGWPRAELHHGLIFHYASVYAISHAVRTSEQATEVPLKSEFLSPFRCKC